MLRSHSPLITPKFELISVRVRQHTRRPTDQPTPSACSLRSRARRNIYDSYDSSDHLSLVRPTRAARSERVAAEFESDCLCESVSVFLVCLRVCVWQYTNTFMHKKIEKSRPLRDQNERLKRGVEKRRRSKLFVSKSICVLLTE